MNEQSRINKQAWEYRAYEFWCNRDGTPSVKSLEILKDPKRSLKKHREYFEDVKGLNIANICGSNGRRAVPLAILGADVTIFDLSEGGILHYFHDLNQLMNILFLILKIGGKLILSDYHPIKTCITAESIYIHKYFNRESFQDDLSYKQFFALDEQHDFPSVTLSHHTLSDIINSVISVGFVLQRFDEHRGWDGENIPWVFTMSAKK